MPPLQWSVDDEQRLADLHATGMTLTAIAKEMSRSKQTIHRRAKDAGLSWDRSQTAKATEAKKIDAAKRRVDLEERYLTEAINILDQLTEPTTITFFDIKEGKVVEHELVQPQFSDKRNIAQASATMANAANRLRDMSVDKEAAAVDKWVDAMLPGDGE